MTVRRTSSAEVGSVADEDSLAAEVPAAAAARYEICWLRFDRLVAATAPEERFAPGGGPAASIHCWDSPAGDVVRSMLPVVARRVVRTAVPIE